MDFHEIGSNYMVDFVDYHCLGSFAHACIFHRWTTRNHQGGIDFLILPMINLNTK